MKLRKLSFLALSACLVQNPASALPVGGVVVSGGASFNNQGSLLTITNTPGAIINWQAFNIAPGETARFVQQTATSAVLNRIVGQDPSQILGALQSNGRVYLVNPNGVVFGAGARVDVNALVASTLDITNGDFAAGRRVFDAAATSTASVVNQGAITTPAGGQVYLIAANVENGGIITSPRGEVVLAAGHHVQLVDSANPDLHVVVSAPADRALNVGTILSRAGSVGIYSALINQRGTVNADSAVVGEDGRIVFRASGQTLLEAGSVTSARGAGEGGTIHVLGDHVGLTGDAVVDASGREGGGTVLVGGDFHGANPEIANASATYVGAQATIRADATGTGNGGRVAIWSSGATRAYGQVSARGGSQSGDGGFVEVSGREFLDYGARTDLRASNGAAGMLLLDPNDVTIQNGPTPPTDIPSTVSPPTFSGGPSSSILTVADLQAQLALGNVTVTTTGGTGGPSGGRITVANALGWSNGFSLTLDADSGIEINGTITAQADGRLLLVSRGGAIAQAAPIDVTYLGITSLGDVNLSSAGNAVTNLAAQVGDASHLNHNFTFVNSQALNVHNFSGLSGISIATSGGYSSGSPDGVISLRTTSGAITQSAGSLLAGKAVYAEGDGVTLTEDNLAGVIAGISTGASLTGFSYTSAGSLMVSTVAGHSGIQSGDTGTFLASSTGNLTVTAPVTVGAAAAVLTASSGSVSGNVTASNVVVTAANGITLTTHAQRIGATNTTSGNIALANTGTLAIGQVTQEGSGSVTIDNTGAATVGFDQIVSTTTGSISISTHSPLTVSGAVVSSGGGAITLAAGPTGSTTDQLTVNGAINPVMGTGVVVSTSGPVLLRAGDIINVTGPISGNVTRQAFLNLPVLPTIGQCEVTPTLPGCNAVLPTMAQCISSPALEGCGVVLPSLAQCVATPVLAGCVAVLPTLAQCTATPTLAGCGVVLPSLAQCTATPTLAGCVAVLPSVAQCAVTPTAPGCSAVLPTVAQCVGAPTLPGCGAVLPALAQCVAVPSTPGCSVVLPSLSQCTASPSIAGCAVVLPSIAQCTSDPAISGCSAVLPSLASCTAAPATPGCAVVLPTLSQCAASPTAAGCSLVLPTLTQCTATPTLAGCNVVLPSLTSCASNPSAPGCAVVLPPTVGQGGNSISVAISTTVNIVNLISPPLSASPPRVITPGGGDAGKTTDTAGGTTSGGTATGGTPGTDAKVDQKVEDKTSTTDTTGAKNEPVKKLYCN